MASSSVTPTSEKKETNVSSPTPTTAGLVNHVIMRLRVNDPTLHKIEFSHFQEFTIPLIEELMDAVKLSKCNITHILITRCNKGSYFIRMINDIISSGNFPLEHIHLDRNSDVRRYCDDILKFWQNFATTRCPLKYIYFGCEDIKNYVYGFSTMIYGLKWSSCPLEILIFDDDKKYNTTEYSIGIQVIRNVIDDGVRCPLKRFRVGDIMIIGEHDKNSDTPVSTTNTDIEQPSKNIVIPSENTPDIEPDAHTNNTNDKTLACTSSSPDPEKLSTGEIDLKTQIQRFIGVTSSNFLSPTGLSIKDCKNLDISDISSIIDAVMYAKNSLRRLEIDNCNFGLSGVMRLCSVLENTKMPLEELKLTSCEVGPQGVRLLCDMLSITKCPINTLDISSNSYINDAGFKYLTDAIRKGAFARSFNKLYLNDIQVTTKMYDSLVDEVVYAYEHYDNAFECVVVGGVGCYYGPTDLMKTPYVILKIEEINLKRRHQSTPKDEHNDPDDTSKDNQAQHTPHQNAGGYTPQQEKLVSDIRHVFTLLEASEKALSEEKLLREKYEADYTSERNIVTNLTKVNACIRNDNERLCKKVQKYQLRKANIANGVQKVITGSDYCKYIRLESEYENLKKEKEKYQLRLQAIERFFYEN